ncbi:maltokinase N-terminal cap-like domain-containing protein [Nocardioides koreensis]
MALLNKATLTPSKRELRDAWLPTRPWATGEAADLRPVVAYRFDDPAGEVGLEGFLLGGVDGSVLLAGVRA